MVQTFRERWLDWLVAAVLLGLFALAVGGSRAAFIGSDTTGNWLFWWDGFLQNSGTEMLGAFLTFVLLELIRGRRERRYQEEAEERRTKQTQELVRGFIQAQELARLRAAQTPEERQPIVDSMKATGLLQGANLQDINLQGANLYQANLQDVNLFQANLQGAYLHGANLQGANLLYASLQGARHLKVEQLRQAGILVGAALPDGTRLPGPPEETITFDSLKDRWREAFEAWARTVGTDVSGFIIPADLPPANPADE